MNERIYVYWDVGAFVTTNSHDFAADLEELWGLFGNPSVVEFRTNNLVAEIEDHSFHGILDLAEAEGLI